jgi:ABC-type amino acid transport substrate-binding protein
LKTQFPDEYGKIDTLPEPLGENKFYNAFSRTHPDYEKNVADFNKGLKAIIDDGTYDKIMKKELHE